MIGELQERFLPRFLETAKSRLARARALLAESDAPSLARELHALAGEAKMLDLHAITEAVCRAEASTRTWSDGPGDDPKAACCESLDAVGAALLSLAPVPKTPSARPGFTSPPGQRPT